MSGVRVVMLVVVLLLLLVLNACVPVPEQEGVEMSPPVLTMVGATGSLFSVG